MKSVARISITLPSRWHPARCVPPSLRERGVTTLAAGGLSSSRRQKMFSNINVVTRRQVFDMVTVTNLRRQGFDDRTIWHLPALMILAKRPQIWLCRLVVFPTHQ